MSHGVSFRYSILGETLMVSVASSVGLASLSFLSHFNTVDFRASPCEIIINEVRKIHPVGVGVFCF